MTVEELIEDLKTSNPKAEVIVSYLDEDGYYCENDYQIEVNDEGNRVVIGEFPN